MDKGNQKIMRSSILLECIKDIFLYHMTAFFLGFLLDLILGDPYCFPHPVRLIGKLITTVEMRLRNKDKNKRKGREQSAAELHQGKCLVVMILCSTVAVA